MDKQTREQWKEAVTMFHAKPIPSDIDTALLELIADLEQCEEELRIAREATPVMNWMTEEELSALAELAKDWDMTYQAVLRKALRLCQMFHTAHEQGYVLRLLNAQGEDFMLVVGCPNVE